MVIIIAPTLLPTEFSIYLIQKLHIVAGRPGKSMEDLSMRLVPKACCIMGAYGTPTNSHVKALISPASEITGYHYKHSHYLIPYLSCWFS